MTKTAEKPYPLGPHILTYIDKGVAPRGYVFVGSHELFHLVATQEKADRESGLQDLK